VWIVVIKVAVLLILPSAFGTSYINRANLHPFVPPKRGKSSAEFGWRSGRAARSRRHFFAFIGFDAV